MVLTTRHHDGFSLYDTYGLSEIDSLHSACKRDWIKANKEFIYTTRGTQIACNGGDILSDGSKYYVIVKNVPMLLNPNVTFGTCGGNVWIDKKIKSAFRLDNGEQINIHGNSFKVTPFNYGTSMALRIGIGR